MDIGISPTDLLLTNLLYTFRVFVIGGSTVYFFIRLFRRLKYSENFAYWVSVLIFAQIAFWIDLFIFGYLFK